MKCGVWNQLKIWSSHLLDNLSNCLINLKNFSGSWDNCLNCPASARIISSVDKLYWHVLRNTRLYNPTVSPKSVSEGTEAKRDQYLYKSHLWPRGFMSLTSFPRTLFLLPRQAQKGDPGNELAEPIQIGSRRWVGYSQENGGKVVC